MLEKEPSINAKVIIFDSFKKKDFGTANGMTFISIPYTNTEEGLTHAIGSLNDSLAMHNLRIGSSIADLPFDMLIGMKSPKLLLYPYDDDSQPVGEILLDYNGSPRLHLGEFYI